MKLYRGDSVPKSLTGITREDRGRSFANHFCGSGLMTKFADGGYSRLLDEKEVLDMVLSHVGYSPGESEQEFSYFSPFLSFSEDEDSAFYFAERSGKKNLEECYIEDATYFIWELDVELLNEIEIGRYQLTYKASSINCIELVSSQIQRGLEHEAATQNIDKLAMGLMNLAAMSYVESGSITHSAELIDVMRYVQNCDTTCSKTRLVNNTLERASCSREWLLYPTDPMIDGRGYSFRFAMNRHLSVHRCYKVHAE